MVNGKKVIAVIQCRMESTRLPGKALLQLAGKPMLWHVIERAKAIEGIDEVIVATTTKPSDDDIVDIAKSSNCSIVRGSSEDVLSRFMLVLKHYPQIDYVVRITADNPFTDPYIASSAVKYSTYGKYDFFSFVGIPIGTGVGIVSRRALERTHSETNDWYHREHVTTYIIEHPDKFLIGSKLADLPIHASTIRLTVDTFTDYKQAVEIYKDLYKENEIFSISEVIKWIDKNNREAYTGSNTVQRGIK